MAIKINLPAIPESTTVGLSDSVLANYSENNLSRRITVANLIALMNANNVIFCEEDSNNYRLKVVVQDDIPTITLELI